jgi:ClpP class serine protease
MIKTFWALSQEELERFYAFREAEKRIRQDISIELIQKIKSEVANIENTDGKPLYERENGIAKISIVGTLEPRITLSSSLMGETTTYNKIEEATRAADEDFQVREIQYHINSSGGSWDGLDFCAETIKGTQKPTNAIIYTGAHSAAYFLASQADHIYAATKGSMVGSIGVAAEIFDRSEADGKEGIKRFVFTNSQSRDKRPDATTEAGAAIIQEELDAIYAIFEDRVVDGRSMKNKDAEIVRKNIRTLKGRSVTAERALELGLIDEISDKRMQSRKNKSQGEAKMDLKAFLAQGPEAESEILAYAKTKIESETEAAKQVELERIQKILTLGGVRISDEVKAAITGGITPEAYAVTELKKQREIEAKMLESEYSPHPSRVPQTFGEQMGKEQKKIDEENATEENVRAFARSIR